MNLKKLDKQSKRLLSMKSKSVRLVKGESPIAKILFDALEKEAKDISNIIVVREGKEKGKCKIGRFYVDGYVLNRNNDIGVKLEADGFTQHFGNQRKAVYHYKRDREIQDRLNDTSWLYRRFLGTEIVNDLDEIVKYILKLIKYNEME